MRMESCEMPAIEGVGISPINYERDASAADCDGVYIDVGEFLEVKAVVHSEASANDILAGHDTKSNSIQPSYEQPQTLVNKRKMGPRKKILQGDSTNNEALPVPVISISIVREAGGRKGYLRTRVPKDYKEDEDKNDVTITIIKGQKGTKKSIRRKGDKSRDKIPEKDVSLPAGKRKTGDKKRAQKTSDEKSPKKRAKKSVTEKDMSFVCSVCSKTFPYSTKLKQHMVIHTDYRPFECDTCEAKFRSKADLCRHLRIHTRETPYSCDYCEKKFIQRAHLIRHTRTHTMEAPFECNFCGRRFNDNSHLTIHKRLHTGSRPYQCDECEKSFISSSNLQIHKRSHSLERSYVCPLCTRSFSTSGSLVRHIRTHTQEKPYKCEFCAKRFCDGSNLRVHRFIHTREQQSTSVAKMAASDA